MPVLEPHMALCNEIADDPGIAIEHQRMVEQDLYPPLVTGNPIFKARSTAAYPTALYVDGLPTTKNNGVMGFWVYL